MLDFKSINSVLATWVWEGEGYLYTNTGSVAIHPSLDALRVKLKEVDNQDYDLEVIISKKDENYVFKTDYYEPFDQEFPLKAFFSDNEIVLYYSGKQGRAYFHLNS